MIQPIDGRTLDEAEIFLAKQQEIEILYVFDERGTQVLKIQGDYETVSVPISHTHLLKNACVTHNHPQGSSFSIQDIQRAVDYDVKEMRVVTSACIFVVTRKEKGWDIDFRDENTLNWLEECKTLARDKLDKEISQNIISLYDAHNFFDSFVWSIFFFNFGYAYKKINL